MSSYEMKAVSVDSPREDGLESKDRHDFSADWGPVKVFSLR